MPLTRDASLGLIVSELSGARQYEPQLKKICESQVDSPANERKNEFHDLEMATLRLTRSNRWRAHHVKQQGFLRVQAVLGLIENLGFDVQRGFLDDFLAVMRGQAMQENCVSSR